MAYHAHCRATRRRFTKDLGVKKDRRDIRESKPADPGLNLEFVDEALKLVRDAEAEGIRLRILGSIAYRLQCPNNLHLFQDTKRVLTDVDFGAEKKQNRAIREFLVERGYVPDEGIYMASEGSRHAYLHKDTGLNVDVFADELYFCHRIPFKGRLDLRQPDHLHDRLAARKDADRRDQPQGLQGYGRAHAGASALARRAWAEIDRHRLYRRHHAPGLGVLLYLHHRI